MNPESAPSENSALLSPPAPETADAGAPDPAPAARATAGKSGVRMLIVGIAAIAVLAVALAGAQWFDTRSRLATVQEELAKRLSASDGQARDAAAIGRQNHETLQTLQAKVGALEAKLAESQSQQLALEALYQELSKSREESIVTEAEQAVSIAAQQLQLAGNVEAALIALSGAEARLARSASPQFLGLRKLIARDIDRLRALPTADVPGMAMKLEGVIASIDAMPFAFEQRPRAEAPSAKPKAVAVPVAPTELAYWQRLAADVWNEFRQLVRVERMDHSDPGLLSPQQTIYLRENLKLRLVNARLALLARDGKSFREDMRQAQAWLERYFDNRAKPVQAALVTVKALAVADVAVVPPGLNETLAALRNFKAAKK
ncbi:MAG: uroporphyrinogen-III C-methyltransferase [Gammaproteobacteria bacterium]|nr:uroporphyrinogen-III C-methyltransferase [Gammaproteobacteria bacterium]MBU1644816.1 uroporphyrinogen-III C-methyltransferase [Gammaproteobacteria bacterium]MBU1973049.1 uroporphyrinogen-III C-methyltransferase [Gammaproteobacteria bacterium]